MQTKTLNQTCLLFHAFLACGSGWFILSVDDWMGISLEPPMYLRLSGIGLALMLTPMLYCFHKGMCLTLGLWVAFVVALPSLNTTAIKPLIRSSKLLTSDMGKDQVLATIFDAFEGTRFSKPNVTTVSEDRIYFKPVGRDPGLDAESLIIDFRNGRFHEAHFSAD
ncbi:MAG: hypothetical protein JKY61_01315 [Planctomycetes bacterium]|nr:hypothetical protein [Planctomycetota bacterium]